MASIREKLHRIFFGNPPRFLLEVPEDITTRALTLQGMDYIYDGPLPDSIEKLNFITFLQDIYELDEDRKKDYEQPTEEVRKRASGIFMRSEFHEWILDTQRSIQQKKYKCIYYKGLLLAFEEVYKVEMIDDQASFVQKLLEYENYYDNLLQASSVQNIPPQKAELKFKEILTDNQQALLKTYLQDNNYIDKPELFVDFLVGKNNGEGINIISGMESMLCYLLYELYQASLIKMTSGKAYQKYIEMSLSPFSQQIEKGQIKYYVRKIQRNKSTKTATANDVRQFVKKLHNAPLLLFFFLLPLFAP